MSENLIEMFADMHEAEKRERLRDELAMAALPVVMQAFTGYAYELIATESYRVADAMLTAREPK